MSPIEREIVSLLPRLRRFARRISRNPSDGDDLTQNTVERALRSQGSWRRNSHLDRWLFKIARNQWIDTIRRRRRRQRLQEEATAATSVEFDPTRGMDASIDAALFLRLMDQLPPSQREVLSLVLVDEVGYRECAQRLKIPVGTVASRLTRGRIALLSMVEELTGPESEAELIRKSASNDLSPPRPVRSVRPVRSIG